MELRKKSVAVLAGVAIAGLVGAAAASLGGLDSDSLGSDDAVVASCHTSAPDITISYGTTYSTTVQGYAVDSVTFSGVDATCDGLEYSLTLGDTADPSVQIGGPYTGTVGLTTGSFDVPVAPGVSAEALGRVSLVIAG